MTTASLPRQSDLSGDYELIAWDYPAQAEAAAARARRDGLVNVRVVQRRGVGPRSWGFAFQVPLSSAVWTIVDVAGRWLSEEHAPSAAAALAIYHATGGSRGALAIRGRPTLTRVG